MRGLSALLRYCSKGDASRDEFAGGQAESFGIREVCAIEDGIEAGKHPEPCGADTLVRRLRLELQMLNLTGSRISLKKI